MNRKCKLVSFATAAVGVVVLIATGFAAKDWIWEQYYIHQLQSPDEQTRLLAVDVLADAKSARAVPHLLRLLAEEKRERVLHWMTSMTGIACGPGGSTYTPAPTTRGTNFTPVAYAIFTMGETARPVVAKALEAEEQIMQQRDESHGMRTPIGHDFHMLLWEITSAWETSDYSKVKRVDYGETGF